MQATETELLGLLRERFGLEEFRPGQERIIRDLLAGRDVLAVMPTGSGKSLLYELASQLLPGVTLVVSPLLALMKDQEDALEELGIAVGAVSSAQSEGEAADDMRGARRGHLKLLYVTPERFDNAEFMAQARRLQVSLLVVDEAHCISEWGHDFRPAYLGLGTAAAALGRPPILALTATATPWVRREIAERLKLHDPDLIVRGVDRPNLFLEVLRAEGEREERDLLRDMLTGEAGVTAAPLAATRDPELVERLRAAMQGSGIIYAATTKGAQEAAAWLTELGIPADFYHGQRRKADRQRVQEQFMDGTLRVIAATTAFGLGVDKPDVRFVIHRDVPANLEGYYQEAGRAGRDGELARCTLIYRPADLGRAAFMAGGGRLSPEDVAKAQRGLAQRPEGTLRELAAATGLSRPDLSRLVAILKREGIVAERRGRLQVLLPDFDPASISLESEEQRKAYERSRLDMLRGYAETEACRREYLLNYFGEELAAPCGRCDNDLLGPEAAAAAVPGEPAAFAVGAPVDHDAWGHGVVQRVEGDTVTVLFDKAGYKTLAAAFAKEQGLLTEGT